MISLAVFLIVAAAVISVLADFDVFTRVWKWMK